MSNKNMKITLKIWRQESPTSQGKIEPYEMNDVSPEMSFLELLDVLNDKLEKENKIPVAFDHDCREGICGMCSLYINGRPHGPETETTTCQLHMRSFKDGDSITVEPWRANGFPVIKDLIVSRTAFDDIIQAGGYISIKTGSAPEAHTMPISKEDSDKAMDAAECIGCGACVASCKNASAMLFVAAKVSQFALLPQGKIERKKRALNMVKAMDDSGFGNCTNEGECEAACPKGISIENIARLNREYICASLQSEK